MDIYCRKCSEPWDSYGITYCKGEGDLTLDEVAMFRKGMGCPACGFGTKCTHCYGTGLEPGESILRAGCKDCGDQHYRFCYQSSPEINGVRSTPYYLGKPPLLVTQPITVLETSKPVRCADGWQWPVKILCPTCCPEGHMREQCSVCHGDRKWHSQRSVDQEMSALESLLDASDEDPIAMIDEYIGGE